MIYWDNNATTALASEVLEAMLPYLREFLQPLCCLRRGQGCAPGD